MFKLIVLNCFNSSSCYVGHLCQDGDKLIRLWIHEVYRVFYDRLIDNEDKETFFGIVKERTSNLFKQSVEKVTYLISVHSHTHKKCFSSVILRVISKSKRI